ncbi:hypothetical protein DYB32_009404 [Aphanomyces invadans]|uniref:G-protein coupled receptors family 1 profile domain-containing protein n=1 Tax=Aphanomyces invadans TaxID=157072 RepID=A0A3R6YSI3_9STRA|nr:hypothetical protein DYB32_009404 [Aphanomyces invadans]
MRNTGHGTMFMMFVSECIWSLLNMARMVTVYANNRLSTLECGPILHITISSEVFFNTTSLWYVAVAYEIQRRDLNSRTQRSSRVTMKWYTVAIFGFLIVLHATLTLLEVLDIKLPVNKHDGKNGMEHLVDHALNYMTWFTWTARCASVVFAGVIALRLYMKRSQIVFQKLPTAFLWIVSLFFMLNMP